MSDLVGRFLATQTIERPADPRVTEAWRELARELGVPCPEALVQLARAGWPVILRYQGPEIDNPWFELESPEQARAAQVWNVEHVRTAGMPAQYAEMMPFANADGDQLLIDAGGAIHGVPFAIYARAGRIADTIEELLVRLLAQPPDDDDDDNDDA